jgi:hypothetical protein
MCICSCYVIDDCNKDDHEPERAWEKDDDEPERAWEKA